MYLNIYPDYWFCDSWSDLSYRIMRAVENIEINVMFLASKKKQSVKLGYPIKGICIYIINLAQVRNNFEEEISLWKTYND